MSSEKGFIKAAFREYYAKNASGILPPHRIHQREFGFLILDKDKEKLMVRHRSFPDAEELRRFLAAAAPVDAYYSAAYYEKPAAEMMGEKKWLGADLIFDIDCDHIKTPCKAQHDGWKCGACGHSGPDPAPARCPGCGGEKLAQSNWVCDVCLGAARRETLKVLGMLEEDLGISLRNTMVVFSGHRGYHIHVHDEETFRLGSVERKEISDYLTGTGLKVEYHGFIEARGKVIAPSLEEPGWAGRLARTLYGLLLRDEDDVSGLGLPTRVAKKLTRVRGELLQAWPSGGGWGVLKAFSLEELRLIWSKILEEAVAAIDTVVTTDTRRLIRLPNSLHGKTGLRAAPIDANGLEDFDPLAQALSFPEGVEVKVKVQQAPRFRLGSGTYGPFRDEAARLPLPVALFLVCRGAARMVEQ